MEQDFVEAVLLWKKGSDPAEVLRWLSSRGLNATTMSSGLLLSGSRKAFASAFGIDLSQASHGLSLPIPEALHSHVSTIKIPGLRKIHEPNANKPNKQFNET